MEPQNNQNNNNNNDDSIKIHPTAGGTAPVQTRSIHTFADDMKNAKENKGNTQVNIKPEEKKAISPQDKIVIHPLHTYADDVRNAVQNDGVSMAQIVMAEAKKHEEEKKIEEEISPSSPKNIKIIILSIGIFLLACAAIVGVWYFVSNRDQSLTSSRSQHKQTIIPYDEEFPVELSSLSRNKLIDGILSAKKQSYELNTQVIYIPISTNNGTNTIQINTEAFLSDLETRIPSALLRAFNDSFMVGIDKSFGEMAPFVILSSTSFNQMYAGMLEWEPAIADDLGNLFFTKEDLAEPSVSAVASTSEVASISVFENVSTSTASSTFISTSTASASATSSVVETEQKEFKSRYIIANSLKFKDEILNNRDMRVLRTDYGKALMYYVFINDKVLLIAKDFRTLDLVIKRLATTEFKQ